MSNGFWKSSNTREGYRSIENLAAELNLKHTTDNITPVWFPEKRFEVYNYNRSVNHDYCDYEKIFVDASVKDDRTGIGGISESLDLNISLRVEDSMNINLAELKAIEICSKTLTENNIKDRKLAFYSDSTEALRLLEQHVISSKIAHECIKNLNRLFNLNTSVEIIWIPKSAGLAQHKKADELSKRATELLDRRETFITKDRLKEMCNYKKKELVKENWDGWISDMSEEKKASNVSLKMFDGPKDSRLDSLPKLNKRDMRVLVGLLTGHCTLRQKLVQMKKGDNSACRWCTSGDNETSLHVLMNCTKTSFIEKRKQLLGKNFLEEQDLKRIPLINLIRFARDTGIQDALCYKPP